MSAPPPNVRGAHTWGRSQALLSAFRVEQSDPDRFYELLAEDSAAQVSAYVDLAVGDAVVLDVGGGPGYFRDAFESRGARYVAIDADAGELRLHGRGPGPRTIMGSGVALPVRSDSVDVCYSSNVLEHVADPWAMADEMLRVTRTGGTVVMSYTVWFGPWGGHETSPWHYVGGAWAAGRYKRRLGHEPKNVFGASLFKVTVAEGVRWARSRAAQGRVEVVDVAPRYHPWWARGVVAVPGLREVATWNLLMALRVRG